MRKIQILLSLIVICFGAYVQNKSILVEAESFDQKGGWAVDQQRSGNSTTTMICFSALVNFNPDQELDTFWDKPYVQI